MVNKLITTIALGAVLTGIAAPSFADRGDRINHRLDRRG